MKPAPPPPRPAKPHAESSHAAAARGQNCDMWRGSVASTSARQAARMPVAHCAGRPRSLVRLTSESATAVLDCSCVPSAAESRISPSFRHGAKITNLSIAALAQRPEYLRDLHITCCYQFTDDAILDLATRRGHTLRSVGLSRCGKIYQTRRLSILRVARRTSGASTCIGAVV